MGHAISGGGFYNIDVEPLRGSQTPGEVFAAIISFKGKPLSEEILFDELKHHVDELWDWQVRKLSEVEFSVVFPSRETLRLSMGSGKLYLPLSKTETAICEAFLAPRPSVLLPSTWVRLTGVPEDLMTKERLMAAFVMVGRPCEVDELSLKKKDTEPIRMRFHCRFPERIKGSIQVFVNGEGFTVGVQAETPPRGGAGGSGGPPKPPARQDEDDDESDGFSTDSEWNRHRRRKNKEGEKAKEGELEKGKATAGAATGKSHKGAAETGQGSQSAPPLGKGTVSAVAAGLTLDQYGSNLKGATSQFSFPALTSCGLEVSQGERVGVETGRAGLEGSSLSTVTDPTSWSVDSPVPLGPPAKVARRDVCPGSTEKEMAMLGVIEAVDGGGEGQVVVKDLVREACAATPVARGPRSAAIPYARRTATKPAAAVRKSSRHGKGAVASTMLEKAQQLVADKNLETVINNNKDVDKGTDFAILDILPDSHLSSVVKDSCIVFSPSMGCPGEALSVVRAKEKVQAALAATARRLRLEAEARKGSEENLPANGLERQGALDAADPVPGTGLPLGERGAGSQASDEEGADRVRGTHLTTVGE
ncbi:hypothetical protein QYE76_014871 [Lolium multiflorum]|uniref:DUF4283 domain-containing protein n=1 Tax=Lolium multiflorum TaxID=4521 RepID=A0AAD8U719_LOLMU|nr:hypothetical protein QYE76_014871 [Lolium multiflorum]